MPKHMSSGPPLPLYDSHIKHRCIQQQQQQQQQQHPRTALNTPRYPLQGDGILHLQLADVTCLGTYPPGSGDVPLRHHLRPGTAHVDVWSYAKGRM